MSVSFEIPETMTVIEIAEFGGPEVLKPAKRPTPTPGAGELLVKTAAVGINFPDTMQRQGAYPPPPGTTDIPGLELAGTVVAVGSGVDGGAAGGPRTSGRLVHRSSSFSVTLLQYYYCMIGCSLW